MHVLSDEEIRSKLRELVSTQILEVDADFGDDTDLFAAGLDSMAIMQLIILIESHFGVQLRASMVDRTNFSTIRQIAGLLS